MSAADVLREARNFLFERGWHKGGMWGDDGSVCSLGAIYGAGPGRYTTKSRNSAACALRVAIDHPKVGHWNDEPERTFDEVVAAFDKAEKIAERLDERHEAEQETQR